MLQLLSLTIQAKLLTEVFTVRIHSRIARNPWARLWYLYRGIDKNGSGSVTIPIEAATTMLDCSEKTIYRWLQKGKRVGAFRRYHVKNGTLQVYLGSLFKVCWFLNLKHWGVVSQCPLSEVNAHIRAIATGIVTQRLQQASRYAANMTLEPRYRKQFGTPHPNELLGSDKQSSLKMAEGQLPYVLHRSEKRLFVSKNFLCFGTSQATISEELYIKPCTIQRHLNILGLDRRQLCQKKGEYTHIKLALDNEADEFHALCSKGTGKYTLSYITTGDVTYFNDGVVCGQKGKEPSVYRTNSNTFASRFFTTGKKRKTTWLAKCNIYYEQYELTTMRAARRKFRYGLQHGLFDNCHIPDCGNSRRRQLRGVIQSV